MDSWRPGKGFYGDLTTESMDWLTQCVDEVWDAYGTNGDTEYGEDGFEGAIKFLKHLHGSATGWKQEKDNFGTKLYKELAWGEQANGTPIKYRFTVVASTRGELKFDLRQWYEAVS
jgi:hypothetical protein